MIQAPVHEMRPALGNQLPTVVISTRRLLSPLLLILLDHRSSDSSPKLFTRIRSGAGYPRSSTANRENPRGTSLMPFSPEDMEAAKSGFPIHPHGDAGTSLATFLVRATVVPPSILRTAATYLTTGQLQAPLSSRASLTEGTPTFHTRAGPDSYLAIRMPFGVRELSGATV